MVSKNIDEVIKNKLGVKKYARYTIILACKPALAKAALDVSKLSGLMFPCSFAVYEEGNNIQIGHVSIMKIIPDIGLAPLSEMKPVIEETGGYIKKDLGKTLITSCCSCNVHHIGDEHSFFVRTP